ncbi:ogr/Delta-like zinc finger family protein [Variovorax sp.]|uniref:ogr/Delta-like zinc finger family protein n=1 Tax=Variovorax sp. TaxID=1871043 RepID=UPI003BA973DC
MNARQQDQAADANNRYMRITIDCPHCGSRCVACDSRAMSKTMREITYRCRNWRCGFTGVATLEFQRVLVLSSIPAADVSLPLSRHIKRGQLALQLADEGNVADDEAAYAANLHAPTNDWGTGGAMSGAPPD